MKFKATAVLALSLLQTLAAGSAQAQALSLPQNRVDAATDLQIFGYPGLEGLNLNAWTENFFTRKLETKESGVNFKTTILNAYEKSADAAALYAELLQTVNKNYDAPQSYKELIDAIFAAKRELRAKSIDSKTRPAIALLNVLAEEAMYVMHFKYPTYMSIWKSDFLRVDERECATSGRSRSASLGEFKVCQGDVIVSKGGQGSSSFISRISDYPGNYSHSTIAYVDAATGKLSFPEAFIEDGTKVRDPYADYVQKPKKKLIIYRLRPPGMTASERSHLMAKTIQGVDDLVDVARSRVDDIENESSFAYDFGMDATDSSTLFCSEIPYLTAKSAGIPIEYNPYPNSVWSQITGVKKEFLFRFLGLKETTFPAPSDIELNASYEVAALQYDLAQFGQDRIDVAMIDTLLKLMQKNPDFVERFLERFDNIGETPITAQQIDYIVSLNILPAPLVEKLRGQIPANVNLKQMIFFAYLNERLTPMIRAKLTDVEKQAQTRGGQPLGLIALRKLTAKEIEMRIQDLMKIAEQIAKMAR